MLRGLFHQGGQLRSGWRIVVYLLLTGLAVWLVNVLWHQLGLPRVRVDGITQPWPFLAFALVIVSCSLAIAWQLLRRLEDLPLSVLGLPWNRTLVTDMLAGTALGAIPICLLVAASVALGYGSLASASVDAGVIGTVMLPMTIAGLLLAGWEELFLRGYLFRQLTLGTNRTTAVVATGVLFGLLHAGNPGANPAGLLYTAIGGMLMAWLLLRTSSLWLLIGYHFGWNFTASIIFGLELSGLEEGASILNTTLVGSAWQTGSSYGFEASLPALIFELLVLSLAIRFSGGSNRERNPAGPD